MDWLILPTEPDNPFPQIPSDPVGDTGHGRIYPPDSHRALCWLAALAAAGIDYRIKHRHGTWAIDVPAESFEEALGELAEYERANRHWPPPPPPPDPPGQSAGTCTASLLAALLLVLGYGLTGPFDDALPVFAKGSAHSGSILSGQWWRTLTSLTLHADLAHALGNAACCLFFGKALSRQLGPGLTWLLILGAGGLGNLASAFATPDYHLAIGASTATFGALGLLAVRQALHNWQRHRDLHSLWSKSWVAIGAGVALLALLGTGPRSDLAGHLFGFGIGALLGLATAKLQRESLGNTGQTMLLALAAGLLVTAWALAAGRL